MSDRWHMHRHDIVVAGASTGGVEALVTLVAGLPADLPAAVFVVLHIPSDASSVLPTILSRAGRLEAVHPVDGQRIEHGCIYCAPPDFHLMVERGRVSVVRGPRENRHRPAVDTLFRSAAYAYGPRVVGIVLTGALDDGSAGLFAIKRRGGVAIVQDPQDAYFPDMPRSALHYVEVDYCAPLDQIPPIVTRLARETAPDEGAYPVPRDMEIETRLARQDPAITRSTERAGQLTGFTCPECKGPLWEIRDGQLLRFRCFEGHAFTADTMLAAKGEAIEDALWAAMETLQESAQVSRRLADEARNGNRNLVARRFDERADIAAQRAEVLRRVLLDGHAAQLDDTFNETPDAKSAAESEQSTAGERG